MFRSWLRHGGWGSLALLFLLWGFPAKAGPSDEILINISIENNQTISNGLSFGPVYFAFHNGNFDPFDEGGMPSNGFSDQFINNDYFDFNPLDTLLANSGSNGVSTVANSSDRGTVNGEYQPGHQSNFNVVVDRNEQNELFIFTQILPSNDAFSATDNSLSLSNLSPTSGPITFFIVADTIFDANTILNDPNGADFGQPFPGAIIPEGDVTGISLIPTDYFEVFDNILLLNGENFLSPPGGVGQRFILGTITISFVAQVATPGTIGISAIGLFGFITLRRRQRKKLSQSSE